MGTEKKRQRGQWKEKRGDRKENGKRREDIERIVEKEERILRGKRKVKREDRKENGK